MFNRLKQTLKRNVFSTRERLIALRVADLADVLPLRTKTRRVAGIVNFQNTALKYVDGPSTYYQVRELYYEKQYDIVLPKAPRILDCGANIGLSLKRFRQRHPHAEIWPPLATSKQN